MTRTRGLVPGRLVPGLCGVASLSLLLLAAACAQAGPGTGGPGPGAYADDDLVLRVEHVGGFVPPAFLVSRLPVVSIYGDGRVITEGPTIAIYPGPALPNVQVAQITKADVNTLVARALGAGVGKGLDLGEPPIADATTTRFTVATDAGTKVTSAYALSEAGTDGTGLSEAQRAARADLQALQAALTDLAATLGNPAAGQSHAYVPTAIAALASPWTEPADQGVPTPPEVAWPGPKLPGESPFEGLDLGCVSVEGEQATQVLAAASTATTITAWVDAGKRWSISFRPLLPDEAGCADLYQNR